jgi:hypothetical protein
MTKQNKKIGKDFMIYFIICTMIIILTQRKLLFLTEEFSFGRNTKIVVTTIVMLFMSFASRTRRRIYKMKWQNNLFATYLYIKNLEKSKISILFSITLSYLL